MRILVYEYFAGGGLDNDPSSLSILCEGLEMLRNLISDFKFVGHSVITILDSKIINIDFSQTNADQIIEISRFEELYDIINEFSSNIDAAYIIAPETNGILQKILKIIKNSGIITLNCNITGIDKVCNKIKLYNYLKKIRIKTPKSIDFTTFDKLSDIKTVIRKNFNYPIIIKPSKGISCEGVSIVHNGKKLKKAIANIKKRAYSNEVIAQELINGINVSICLLSSDNKARAISLNKQNLTIAEPDNISEYKGGIVPFESPLKKKAFALAEKTINSIEDLKGFIGIDLILTNNDVVVIEINPRLTTSYIGLRKVTNINLAKTLIDCHFEKNIPAEIKNEGYSYFSKIKIPINLVNSFNSNLIEEITIPPLKIPGYKAAFSLISIKSRNKKALLKKIAVINKKIQLLNTRGNR